ncbi:MAG: ABC transporter substrate-binding protein [Anaerolineaceae bacterium]|nr:ABC transporter substrate-binding protein [Anaerolineaceae bacterium]
MKRLFVLMLIVAIAAVSVGGAFAQESGGTLRAAFQNDWESLDPQVTSSYSSLQILNNVLETLTTFDDNLELAPGLAESWEQSEDGLTWTFNLREGVMFSNGEELTADDVVFTYMRFLDPEGGFSGSKENIGPEGTVVEAVDDYTVTITTPEAVAIAPILLGLNKATGIIHPDSVEEDGSIITPIGTGPFMISEVEGTSRILLERNPNYWQEGLPYLDAVEIIPIPDDTVRETSLLGGEVDWVLAIAPQSFEALDANEEIIVETAPQLSYDYVGLNLTREPFDDVRVRQAISYAMDREQICQAAYFGLCDTLTGGPVGSGSPWQFDYTPYADAPDLDKARELLAEAGYPDGFEMEWLPTSAYGETVRAAQVIQAQMQQIGIQSTINAPEWAEWLELEGNFMYDAYICSWNGLKDADQYYYLQHRTGLVFNFTGFSNPEFDELVDEGRTVSDFESRYDIYQQANEILVDEAPYIFMYNKLEIRAYDTGVNGFVVRPDQANNFWTVWLSE